MDNRDEKILNILLEDGRVRATEIAKKLDISETAVRKRIQKLEKIGAIKAYTAIVDPFLAGFESVALVGIDAKPAELLRIYEKVKDLKNIRRAALTGGDHSIMVELWCKTTKEFNQTLRLIEKQKGVVRICPAVFLKSME